MQIPIDRLELIAHVESILKKPIHRPTPATYRRIIEKRLKDVLNKLRVANTLQAIGKACGERFPEYGISLELPEYWAPDTKQLTFLLEKLKMSKAKTIRIDSSDRKLFELQLTGKYNLTK